MIAPLSRAVWRATPMYRSNRALSVGSVEAGGRLVEDEQQGVVAHHRAAEGELLPLPAGELLAVGEGAPEAGQEALGHLRDDGAGSGTFEGRANGVVVVETGEVADADNLRREQLGAQEVLERGRSYGRARRRGRARRVERRRRRMRPDVGSYMRVSSLTKVVLPAPLRPTRATAVPAGRCKDTSVNTSRSVPGILEADMFETYPVAEPLGRGQAAVLGRPSGRRSPRSRTGVRRCGPW